MNGSNAKESRQIINAGGGIQVIARAAAIMRALRQHPNGLTLSQIAREVGLARSTVHRIVASLESEHYVSHTSTDSSGGYQLGPALAVLGAAVNHKLRDQLRPYLNQLFLELNETIDLATLQQDQLIFVDQIAAPHRLQAVSGVGGMFPLHCTANGKAMLAQLSAEQLQKTLPAELTACTSNTITDHPKLQADLAQIRTDGVAFDREEHTLGICAVGSAFTTPLARCGIAAVSIPVPSIRFYGNEQRLVDALLTCCQRIRQHLAAI